MTTSNDKMFETTITGEGLLSKTVSSTWDEAAEVLYQHIGKPVSGHVVDGMTGEVLAIMEDGNVTYTAPEMQELMLRAIAKKFPEAAKELIVLSAMAALLDPDGKDQFVTMMNLLEDLYGSEEATSLIMDLTLGAMSIE